MPISVVRFADAPAQAWKNGGGVTRELWREPATGDFDLRLSVAEVASDGPFSPFPGVDRVITLVHGAGFVLRGPTTEAYVTEVAAPYGFSGDDDVYCSLVDGPVRDFNVMVRRGRRVTVCRVGAGDVLGAGWLLALTPLALAGMGNTTLAVCDVAVLPADGAQVAGGPDAIGVFVQLGASGALP